MTKTLVGTPDPEEPSDDEYVEMVINQLDDTVPIDEVIRLRAVIVEQREIIQMQRLLISLLLNNDEL